MKKLSTKRHQYLCRRLVRDNKRLLNEARERKRARLRTRDARRSESALIRVSVSAPQTIIARVSSERERLMQFISRVTFNLHLGRRVHLDLSDVENFHPCGTLIFLSQLDIWFAAYAGKITGTYPGNDRSEELLQHFGVLAKLGLPHRLTVTHDNVRFWHYYSGTTGDASIYQALTRDVLANIEHPQGLLFGDCLNEAVANTVNHAYCFERKSLPPLDQRRWWMLSEVKDGKVFVAIFDWGVTIPASLRRKPEWMDYLKLRRWKDARLIEAATATKRTSTRLPHRGKGLPEMVEFSKNLASGGLSISSGMGSYVYYADTDKFARHHFTSPMPGTLVLWQIPFREERHHADKDDIDR